MMKRILLGSLVLMMVSLMLAGCSVRQYPFPKYRMLKETWMNAVEKNPARWMRKADRWFRTGEPNATEIADRRAPRSAHINTVMIQTPNYHELVVSGDFQLQVFGTSKKHTIYALGPDAAIRSLVVTVNNGVLCIRQRQNTPRGLMKKVIIRVGINYLTKLTQEGCGSIEGFNILGKHLVISSSAPGDIYLSGKLGLQKVTNASMGSINLFGVRSRKLDIGSYGSGDINLAGVVGIRSIVHRRTGNVNVIGADSDYRCAMSIDTEGAGKIGLYGAANIGRITARQATCVYAYGAISNDTYVSACDFAQVGISGVGRGLHVKSSVRSQFYGRDFCVTNAYVRAFQESHVNVAPNNSLFVEAAQGASVYYFSKPKNIARFVSQNAVVLPMWEKEYCHCQPMPVASVEPVAMYPGAG